MALKTCQSDEQRLATAKELFTQQPSAVAALALLNSKAGILVVRQPSAIRIAGDEAAHGVLSRDKLQPMVDRKPVDMKNEILALVEYVCSSE